ncbi:MAG TPA: class I SAM-dependent methyltransferase [Rhodanobacteraceae bacterium]|nr:class I SAM-dependent methyltransferase [Rhodanobacteraceae bacterium]
MNQNAHSRTIASFGDEWRRFDQASMTDAEATEIMGEYFGIFPWDALPQGATGFDMGCGSGRWARLIAPRVGHLHCIDPSDAIDVARLALGQIQNVTFHCAGANDEPLPRGSQDFGYSLGVLHHVPDTQHALNSCVQMLKPGAPFLVYLYYRFDNRRLLFRAVWRCSDMLRRFICTMPPRVKHLLTDALALIVYWPLARVSKLLEKSGLNVSGIPLSYYRNRSFYTMRTDSRDRFGTPLEKRFTRAEILRMMKLAGLVNVRFSETQPYWCAVGIRAAG